MGRYSPKDVADIVSICSKFPFSWKRIIEDASEKDLWINPIHIAEVLESFPAEKLDEIIWIGQQPDKNLFTLGPDQITREILSGSDNSLFDQM